MEENDATTVSKMTLSIKTVRIIEPGKIILNVMTVSIDTQHNETQHKDN